MGICGSKSTDAAVNLADLLARAGVETCGGQDHAEIRVTEVMDDSRAVGPGMCFVAVRGATVDGHDFVEDAARAGACAVIVDRDVKIGLGIPVVRVKDSRVALAKLAAAFFGLRDERPKAASIDEAMKLIGVTGTNGKTTVTWLLRSILKAAGHPTALMGTVEYDLIDRREPAPLTTPGALELAGRLATARVAGAKFAVLELSSHALDQRRCDGLTLAAGVFTNISGDHLDYHGSMEAYVAAKRRLFDGLDASAFAIVNLDDSRCESVVAHSAAQRVTYAIESGSADVRGEIVSANSSGTTFTMIARSYKTTIRLGLVGRYNVANALAAAATAEALDVDAESIQAGLEAVTGVPGRLERVEPPGCAFSVLVDYAHTDDALRSVLASVRPLTQRRLICVFGCGGDRDRSKRPRMAAAAASADVALVTSDNPRGEDPQAIIDDILPGFAGADSCEIIVEVDRRRAIQEAIALADDGDTVLIAGKGHETYQLVGDQVLPFDDAAVARECLRDRAAAPLAGGVA